MAMYLDEEEVWKCPKHPSKRRRSGICSTCLRDRLVTLCPDCAKVRPCSCCPASSSSSTSSSSSFSRFSFAGDGGGSVGRVHTLVDSEPSLRKSRSVAIPFLRSRSRFSGIGGNFDTDSGGKESPAPNRSGLARSFLSVFKSQKSSREQDFEAKKALTEVNDGDLSSKAVMARSRSVAVLSDSGGGELRGKMKGKGWFFPSPMKAFRNSKVSKVVQERSPLYRG
ncbi:unnamed protein product [Lupinus luteus]|uniref:Uncharacterized protein n=1 Tax=Lupinus luteus TaxID=3873 RepID=A0AAV1YC73_LUPLU